MNPLSPTRRSARTWTSPPSFTPGSYLTDGRRLFRVVSHFTPGTDQICASLEDCMTLEVETYAPSELYSMELRTVRAAV